jgi:chromosome segregation ATPase
MIKIEVRVKGNSKSPLTLAVKMSSIRSQIEDIILALAATHGKDVVTEAATRTLPVISFAESNKGIEKYKDELVKLATSSAKAEDELVALKPALEKLKEENTVLHRLITNLEGEVKRQAKELKELEAKKQKQPLIERIAGCPGAYITNSNPHKILVEDSDEIIGEAISLSDDMVLATIHCEGGSATQVYMPLEQFLLFYSRN